MYIMFQHWSIQLGNSQPKLKLVLVSHYRFVLRMFRTVLYHRQTCRLKHYIPSPLFLSLLWSHYVHTEYLLAFFSRKFNYASDAPL